MAHLSFYVSWLLILSPPPASPLKTCPGFPGYCSESFPGQFCNVVCDRGRNNVPLCQEDGTWTDIPRCIEHDPGVEEQVPGICPGIPGYCAQGYLQHRCKFDCVTGPDIDSLCTADGTWSPYPTCEGDLRETQDGCDGCPGPRGGLRNRTAEAFISANTVSDRRIPKFVADNGGRKTVPSFAGNINIGPLGVSEKSTTVATTTQSQIRKTSSTSSVASTRSAVAISKQNGDITPALTSAKNILDRIKADIASKSRVPSTQSGFSLPQATPKQLQPRPVQPTRQAPPSGSTFGIFDQVNLGTTGQSGPSTSHQGFPAVPGPRKPLPRGAAQPYGEFQTVKLQ